MKSRDIFDMAKIKFNIERCKGCGLCVIACPRDNIRMSAELNKGGHKYAEIIDEANCNGCGMCFRMCPDIVIEISNPKSSKEKVKIDSNR